MAKKKPAKKETGKKEPAKAKPASRLLFDWADIENSQVVIGVYSTETKQKTELILDFDGVEEAEVLRTVLDDWIAENQDEEEINE